MDSTHLLIDWIHKQDPAFCCIQETNLNNKDRHYLRVKGWKKVFQANGPRKQAGVTILISNKILSTKSYQAWWRRTLHIYQGENPPRETLNSEHQCSKYKSTQIHKRNFSKPQNTHWTPINNSGRFQHTTLTNGQVIETETKERQTQWNWSRLWAKWI